MPRSPYRWFEHDRIAKAISATAAIELSGERAIAEDVSRFEARSLTEARTLNVRRPYFGLYTERIMSTALATTVSILSRGAGPETLNRSGLRIWHMQSSMN
ncbi:hypothetical protein SAMN05519103_05307 [Rhizobiales bacterium GAS113]|nr:hypothetical protein SAMN05519103_05307 [Rhizobiales bacterium GAS113]